MRYIDWLLTRSKLTVQLAIQLFSAALALVLILSSEGPRLIGRVLEPAALRSCAQVLSTTKAGCSKAYEGCKVLGCYKAPLLLSS